jgi:hypothetical protein
MQKQPSWLPTLVIVVLGVLMLVLLAYPLIGRNQPVVIVFMSDDCSSCRAWRRYLRSEGFRTRSGTPNEWVHLRRELNLATPFRARHSGKVEGLLLEGHVPAEAIRSVLARPGHQHIRGLAVPGIPEGGPGLFSFSPQPYVVYAVMPSGLVRPYGEYQHLH